MHLVRRSSLPVSSLALVALFALQSGAIGGCAPADDPLPGDGEEVNPSRSDALQMSACNTALGTFDGTTAFSNGGDTGTGYSCAGSGAYGLQYQCVELVMRHFKTHWGLSWHGNAKDLLANAPSGTVDVYMNGDAAHPPVPGDMVVWKNGTYGHVALVTAVHADGVDILEQNVKGNGHATLPYDGAKIGARWGNWVPAGWAHAKDNTSGGGGTGGAGGSGSSSATGGGTTSSTSGGGTTSSGGNTSSTGSGNPVSWSCNDSAYNGQQYWTCSGGNIYRCQNGVPEEQVCASGCNVNALGTDDTCKSQVQWNCNNSAYNGQQYWTCSGGNIYRCQNGVPEEQACANGCKSNPLGTDDACK
jgi:hypothetical protein